MYNREIDIARIELSLFNVACQWLLSHSSHAIRNTVVRVCVCVRARVCEVQIIDDRASAFPVDTPLNPNVALASHLWIRGVVWLNGVRAPFMRNRYAIEERCLPVSLHCTDKMKSP